MWLIQVTSIVSLPRHRHTERAHKSRKIGIWCLFRHFWRPVPYNLQSNVLSSWASLFWVHMSVCVYFCMHVCVCVWLFCIFYAHTCIFVSLQTGSWFSPTNRPFRFPKTLTRISNHFAVSVLLTLVRTIEILKYIIWWVILPLLT